MQAAFNGIRTYLYILHIEVAMITLEHSTSELSWKPGDTKAISYNLDLSRGEFSGEKDYVLLLLQL